MTDTEGSQIFIAVQLLEAPPKQKTARPLK